ncbi:hypothetical protein [Tsukamurella soli]|uniref:Uncharacterized protein n=1 Tax=Tsukamurella soli TaxID=644556 RepID=A0ABP8JJE7_9ACTN
MIDLTPENIAKITNGNRVIPLDTPFPPAPGVRLYGLTDTDQIIRVMTDKHLSDVRLMWVGGGLTEYLASIG